MPHVLRRTSCVFVFCLLPAVACAGIWTFSVDAQSGGLQAGAHHFGTRIDASLGLDAHDVPEPPPPPSESLTLALRMPGDPDPWPNRWHHEFRPQSVFFDDLELWELVLETDRPGEPVTLSVDLVLGEPSEAEVYLLTDVDRTRMDFPTSLTLTPQAAETVLWIEVHVHDVVAEEAWGVSEVKRLFR